MPVGKRWETGTVHRRPSTEQSGGDWSRVEVWIGGGDGGEPQEEQLGGKRVPDSDGDRANGRGE